MRTIPMLVLVLAGCSMGPAPETLLSDLRVVAVDAAAPEVAPGDVAELTALVADPKDEPARIAMWSCTSLGPPDAAPQCAEAAAGWGLGTPYAALVAGAPEDETFTASVPTSPALAEVLSEDLPTLPVGVWVVACRDGLCPVLDAIDEALATGVIDEGLAADLADPPSWLEGLPFDGVSLARRSVRVSNRPAAERNTNPVLGVEAPGVVAPEGTVDVVVHAEDAEGDEVMVAPYTTAGGFGTVMALLADAEPSPLPLFAPGDAGAVKIYVAATDGNGGSASWRGEVAVEDAP